MKMKFEPGPDWRRLTPGEEILGNPEYVAHYTDDGTLEMWIPNEPHAPLPTVPHTVIEVTWKTGRDTGKKSIMLLDKNGNWVGNEGNSYDPDRLYKWIEEWERLASPWGETERQAHDEWKKNVERTLVKKILDRRHDLKTEGHEFPDEQIAAEYGVHWKYE